MHHIQAEILQLLDKRPIHGLTLKQIGDLVHEPLPQSIQHHLRQLELKGFISINKKTKEIVKTHPTNETKGVLVALPILGAANCGHALNYANDMVEGFLKVSKNLLPKRTEKLFIVKADGDSMNKAQVNAEKTIDDGDYVLVNAEKINPTSGDYVISLIDGMANIKKFIHEGNRIKLLPESTKNYSPIFIHPADDYKICGTVIDVFKV